MSSNALNTGLTNAPPAILSDSAYQQATSQIFWGVLGVLLLAGLVGMVLARIPLAKKPAAVMANFSSRVRLWWWMAAGRCCAHGGSHPSRVASLCPGSGMANSSTPLK